MGRAIHRYLIPSFSPSLISRVWSLWTLSPTINQSVVKQCLGFGSSAVQSCHRYAVASNISPTSLRPRKHPTPTAFSSPILLLHAPRPLPPSRPQPPFVQKSSPQPLYSPLCTEVRVPDLFSPFSDVIDGLRMKGMGWKGVAIDANKWIFRYELRFFC